MLVQGMRFCGGSRGSRLERACRTPQPRVRLVQRPCSVGPERDPGRRAHVESAGRPARDRVTAAVLRDTRPCCSAGARLPWDRAGCLWGELFQNSHGNLAAGLGHGVPASGRGEVPTRHREAGAGSSPPAPGSEGRPGPPRPGHDGGGGFAPSVQGPEGTASGGRGADGQAQLCSQGGTGREGEVGEHPHSVSTLLCSPIARWVGGRGAPCPQRPRANRPGLGSRIHRACRLPLAKARHLVETARPALPEPRTPASALSPRGR